MVRGAFTPQVFATAVNATPLPMVIKIETVLLLTDHQDSIQFIFWFFPTSARPRFFRPKIFPQLPVLAGLAVGGGRNQPSSPLKTIDYFQHSEVAGRTHAQHFGNLVLVLHG